MRQRLIASVMSALAVAMVAASLAGFQGGAALQPTSAVTIRAETLLDGRGGVAKDVVIRIENGRIASVRRSAERVRYSLPGATVMPGWIDTHVHPDSHFNKDGRADNRGETPVQEALYWTENAWLMLQGGFTTVQSLGALSDVDLRTAIERGLLPGPECSPRSGKLGTVGRSARILMALRPASNCAKPCAGQSRRGRRHQTVCFTEHSRRRPADHDR